MATDNRWPPCVTPERAAAAADRVIRGHDSAESGRLKRASRRDQQTRETAAGRAMLRALRELRQAINTDQLRFSENANIPGRAAINDGINAAIRQAEAAGIE